MLELSAWAGLEPAILDVKTVSGLAQVFELTLTDSAGSEVDLSGVSFRGAVNTAPLQEFVCSVKGGKLLFGWSCLPAGRHSFDLFMVTGGAERALVHGAMVVAGRVVPPLGEGNSTVNDAATLVLPDTVDGVIRVELSEAGLVDLLSRRAGAFADGAEAALKSIEELKRWIGEKVEGFGSVADAAVKAVTDAGTEAVSAVEGAGTVATEAVKTAKDVAVQSVRDEKGTAVKAVTDAGTEAVSAVEGTGTVATEAVKTAKDAAVQSVRDEKGTAVKAVTDAKTEAVSSVEGAGTVATEAVKAAKGDAVQSVNDEKAAAVKAVTDAKTGAVEALAGVVQDVTDAEVAIQMAKKEVDKARTRAEEAEEKASSAATEAQQALEAMPQVDANGNMVLTGNLTLPVNKKIILGTGGACVYISDNNAVVRVSSLASGGAISGSSVSCNSVAASTLSISGASTFGGILNANGGVNIPVVASPITPTSGVNRLVASGLPLVSDAFSPQSYLSSSEIYGDKVSVQQTVPGLCWLLRNSAPMSAPVPSTVKVIYISPFSGVCNYSGWRGFLLPIMLGNNGGRIARKLTFFVGTISLSQCVVSTAADIDIFTLSPKSGQVLSFARIIDVTFYMTSDSTLSPAGYPVRVRELLYDSTSARYMVHTTVSVIPSFNNNPSGNMFISYQQADLSAANPAGLWIGSNGYDGRRLLRIANLHAVRDTFNYMGTNSMYWDCGAGDSYIGSLRHVMAPGNNQQNGAYHAFTALETKLFQSTSTEEFVHYE